MEVSELGEGRRKKKRIKSIDTEEIAFFGGITAGSGFSAGSAEDEHFQDGSSGEERVSSVSPVMDMMYGVSGGPQSQASSYSAAPYSHQTGLMQAYPHRGSSSSDTSGHTPKPVNIEQYLANVSQEPVRRSTRKSRAERPSSHYDNEASSEVQYGYYQPSQPQPVHQPSPQEIMRSRATPENLYLRKYASQDESYRKPSQTLQRGSWDGSRPTPPDDGAKKGRWNRDRSLDTVSKRRGNTTKSMAADSYPASSSALWDPNRISRDSSMESLQSDSSKVVKSSNANVLAYTPRRAKPFVSGRSTTVDISSLDRSNPGTTGSFRDISQPIQENKETSFVAPWRVKERPSSQVFEPIQNKEAVQKRHPLVKSVSLEKPFPSVKPTHCDSPDLDDLVEANIEAAKDSPRTARKARKDKNKEILRKKTDHRIAERAKTRAEYGGEELSYCPAVTYQPIVEKHMAQVTKVDPNKIIEKQTLAPPEEETQNLSDFEKHLLDIKSELKTAPKAAKKEQLTKEKERDTNKFLGTRIEVPKPPAVVNGRDEKNVIEALKDEKPALAELLQKDSAPPKAPEYHDTELADKIASEKQKEIKRKQLLFKLGAIRQELSSRIGSIEDVTHSTTRSTKNKPLMKSKSSGEEKFAETKKAGSTTKEVRTLSNVQDESGNQQHTKMKLTADSIKEDKNISKLQDQVRKQQQDSVLTAAGYTEKAKGVARTDHIKSEQYPTKVQNTSTPTVESEVANNIPQHRQTTAPHTKTQSAAGSTTGADHLKSEQYPTKIQNTCTPTVESKVANNIPQHRQTTAPHTKTQSAAGSTTGADHLKSEQYPTKVQNTCTPTVESKVANNIPQHRQTTAPHTKTQSAAGSTKGADIVTNAPQDFQITEQRLDVNANRQKQTKQHPKSDLLQNVVSQTERPALITDIRPNQDAILAQQDTRPFSPVKTASNISKKNIMSPIHMTTKTSSIHKPQMGISYSSVTKPSTATTNSKTSTLATTTTSSLSPSPVSMSLYNKSTRGTTDLSNVTTQNVSTVTTSTVTTSHTTNSVANTVVSSMMTIPVTTLPSNLHVSENLNQQRSKSLDTQTHGALSLVKAIQSRLTGKSSGKISPRPDASPRPDISTASRNMQESPQDFGENVAQSEQIAKASVVSQMNDQPPQSQISTMDKNEATLIVNKEKGIVNQNSDNISPNAQYVPTKQEFPAKAKFPLPVTDSNLVYQGTAFTSPSDLLSHQLQQIPPFSKQDLVQSQDFKPMAETLDKEAEKQSHLDLYERKHALSTHRAVGTSPKLPEFGISYLKKAPTTDKINEDLGRLDDIVGYQQVVLIETPKSSMNRTASPRRQYSTEMTQTLAENVFQFPPPPEKENYLVRRAEVQRKQREDDEIRRKELYREDSFARESSPEYSPIPLPKDSVILRNKLQRLERRDSTSSDSDVTVGSQSSKSPRLSPRTMRKHAQAQKMRTPSNRGSTSSGIGVELLNIPSASSTKDGLHIQGRVSKASQRGSTTSLPQNSKLITGSRERVYHTPPETPKSQFSKKSQTLPAGILSRTASADTMAVIQRQDNATTTTVLASDSSTCSKRGEGRRRFRKRDTPIQSDQSGSTMTSLQTETTASNIQYNSQNQQMPHKEELTYSNIQEKEQYQQQKYKTGHQKIDGDLLVENADQVSLENEAKKVPDKLPDSSSTPVIILKAEPVIHEVAFIPSITTEPVIQEIVYTPILTSQTTQPPKTQENGESIDFTIADHFLVDRSADFVHKKSETKVQGQDSRPQYHPRPALLKQKHVESQLRPALNETPSQPAIHRTENNESLIKTHVSVPKEPSGNKVDSVVTKQQSVELENVPSNVDKKYPHAVTKQTFVELKNPPLTLDKRHSHTKLDSDPELKDNRKELDSAIETLDGLTKELEERHKGTVDHRETNASVKSTKKTVTDVNAALSVLRQNSLGEKQTSSKLGSGSRGIGYRPSPLQLSNVVTTSQVPKTPPSEILSPPVVITSKKISDSQEKPKDEIPVSKEQPVLMRNTVKGKSTSPSRPKSGLGAGLLLRSQAQEKTVSQLSSQKVGAPKCELAKTKVQVQPQQVQVQPAQSVGQSRTDHNLQHREVPPTLEQNFGHEKTEQNISNQQLKQEKPQTDQPEPKRQQSSFLMQKLEQQQILNKQEDQKRKEQKVHEENLKRRKIEEDNLRKQKEEGEKLRQAKQNLEQQKLDRERQLKEEIETKNLQKQKQEQQNIQQKNNSDKLNLQNSGGGFQQENLDPSKAPQQRVSEYSQNLPKVKSEERQSNETYQPPASHKSNDPKSAEQMLMRGSQGGTQPSTVQKQQQSQPKPVGAQKQAANNTIAANQTTTDYGAEASKDRQSNSQKHVSMPEQVTQTRRLESTAGKVNTGVQRQKQQTKQPTPPRQLQGTHAKTEKLEKHPPAQKQAPVQKQPSPQRQVQNVHKPYSPAQNQAPAQKQPSPQRQVQNVHKPSEARAKSGQLKQTVAAAKKGSSPQRTVQTSPQRAQSSPQRQHVQTHDTIATKQKVVPAASKTVDTRGAALSRRTFASPQRSGNTAHQQKDGKGVSPSAHQQQQGNKEKSQPSPQRTVRKTTTTTTTYSSGPGQKVQHTTTTTRDVKPDSQSVQQKEPTKISPNITDVGRNVQHPKSQEVQQKEQNSTKPQHSAVPVEKIEHQSVSTVQEITSKGQQIQSKEEQSTTKTATHGFSQKAQGPVTCTTKDVNAQRRGEKFPAGQKTQQKEHKVEEMEQGEKFPPGHKTQQNKHKDEDVKQKDSVGTPGKQSTVNKTQSIQRKKGTSQNVPSSVQKILPSTQVQKEFGIQYGSPRPSDSQHHQSSQHQSAKSAQVSLEIHDDQEKKQEVTQPAQKQEVASKSTGNEPGIVAKKQATVQQTPVIKPLHPSIGKQPVHIKTKSVEDNTIALPTVQRVPISIETSSTPSASKAKVPLETHFPSSDCQGERPGNKMVKEQRAEELKPDEQPSQEVGQISGGPAEGQCVGAAETSSTMVGVALSRLHRHHDNNSSKDQLTSRKYDIQSGHRDVGSLSRKFGGSQEVCKPQPCDQMQDIGLQQSACSQRRSATLRSATEPTQPATQPTCSQPSSTEPTQPATQPTKQPVKPTQTTTEPAKQPVKPTQTPTHIQTTTQPATQPTKQPVKPTQTPTPIQTTTEAATQPAKQPVKPTQTPIQTTTEAATQPTKQPVKPSQTPIQTTTEVATQPAKQPVKFTQMTTPAPIQTTTELAKQPVKFTQPTTHTPIQKTMEVPKQPVTSTQTPNPATSSVQTTTQTPIQTATQTSIPPLVQNTIQRGMQVATPTQESTLVRTQTTTQSATQPTTQTPTQTATQLATRSATQKPTQTATWSATQTPTQTTTHMTEAPVTRSRRTPERATSLRDEKRATPEKDRAVTKAYSSFREGDVKRRKPRGEKSDNLVDNELQKILNRRSNYLEDWEQQVQSSEGETAADKTLAQFEARLKKEKAHRQDAVIVDRELSQMLEHRRANTDSDSDTQTKTTTPATSSSATVTKQQAPKETASNVTSILKQTSSFEMEIPERPVTSTPISQKAPEKELSQTTKQHILSKSQPDSHPDPFSMKKDLKPILKKDTSFDNHQSVLTSSIVVMPEFKEVAKRQASPVQKTMRHFKLQKSKTLGEMPSESSEKLDFKQTVSTEVVKPARPILRKAKTFDSTNEEMDAELASLLKSRRKSSSDEGDEKTPDKPEEESTEKESEVRLSVAERIFQMQSKIEESSLPVSKTGSGSLGTPRLKISSKSMPSSPGLLGNHSVAGESPVLSLVTSEDDLLSKLTDVATAEKTAADRRKRFQKSRDNWRRRTQPITEEEVRSADALETVCSFRAEILRNTSVNFFKQQAEQKDDSKTKVQIKKVKGQENFPQPLKRDRFKEKRKNNLGRFKSLPELNKIPESELLVAKESLTKKWASEIGRNKVTNTQEDDVELHPKNVVPTDIVKEKANLFKQRNVPEIQIESNVRSENSVSYLGTDSQKGVPAENKITTTSVETKSLLNETSPRDRESSQVGIHVVPQKHTALLSRGAKQSLSSSQSNVTSSTIVSQTVKKDEDILSSDDDFDKLVAINARTLIENSSSSVSENVISLKITDSDLSPKMESATWLKPPESNVSNNQPSSPEDEMSKMSVSQKLSKFTGLDQQESAVTSTPTRKVSSSRRLMSRKERVERSQTQPITEDELSSASTYAKNQKTEQKEFKEKKDEVDAQVVEAEVDSTASEDDLSKLSLAEKMKLFSSPSTSPQAVEETTPPPKNYYQAKRKGKKFQSRFKTQPVTTSEVQKATRISPLAMSLVKPPDPDTMKGLSVQEQREVTAKHAEMTLAQSGSRSFEADSEPALCVAETGTNEEVNSHEGILKHLSSEVDKETKGILKSSSHQTTPQSDSVSSDTSRKGILKHKTHEEATEIKGILKAGLASSPVDDDGEVSTVQHSQQSTQGIRGILKTDTAKMEADDRLHGILKSGHSEKYEIRSILKSTPSGDIEESATSGTFQNDLQSICDTDETKSEVDRDQLRETSSALMTENVHNELTSGSSEYQTASESEALHSTSNTLSKGSDELLPTEVFTSEEKDRLEALDIRVVRKSDVDLPTNASKSNAVKTVVSKTSLRLSSSDTSDTDEHHAFKVLSGQQTSPTRLKNDSLFQEHPAESKVESRDSSSLGDSVVKTISAASDSTKERQDIKSYSVKKQDSADKTRLRITCDSSTDEDHVQKNLGIKNEAVARRRLNRELRKSGDRYHTQPVDSTGQDGVTTADSEQNTTEGESRRGKRIVSRHHTQPITPTEKEAVETLAESGRGNMSGSIADRLSSLQQHGENEWKKRLQRDSPSPGSSGSSSPSGLRDRQSQLLDKVTGGGSEVKLRKKADILRSQERPVSLAARLSCLEDAQGGWKKRVEDTDASKFTVEGKMSGRAAASPLVDKRHTRANLNRELDSVLANGFASPSRKRMTVPTEVVSLSTPSRTKQCQDSEAASTPNIPVSTKIFADLEELSADSDENKENAVVEVPRADDEAFNSFYSGQGSGAIVTKEKVPVTLDDLNLVKSHQVLTRAKRARPQSRQTRASKNPLKALAQRADLKTEYEQFNTGVAEKELRRIKTEQIAGKACMATDALAALACKENFDKVKLRKAEASASSPVTGRDRFLPYKDLMLLQVKGRRACQSRLVSPVAHSINSGDCFILVTPNKVYVWIGEFCNVIEKSKAMDVAQTIQQKKDLGCKSISDPCVILESKDHVPSGDQFWKLLGGRSKPLEPGPSEEDELYEMYLSETNMVYRVQGEHLVAMKEQWGQMLKHSLLTNKEAFVFDFGSEVYVWTGKHVAVSERKTALKLATEIWGRGYDYTNCEINPLSPLQTESSGGLPLKSDSRPEWTLLGKVNENMETILFKDKFIDWPDSSSKIIKMKEAEQDVKFEFVELQACDVEAMLAPDTNPVDLVLEGSHIGRGDKWVDSMDGIRREYEVVTIDIDVWHVLQYEHFKLEPPSFGQFHDGDTFVIRWHYMVRQSGIKTLKGKDTSRSQTGREKCAYFFWQGQNSSITEKGASALMTVELDEERGPQLRVVQGKEPPCFIRLFNGHMTVHIGKREEEDTNTQGEWKLYMVRNDLQNEAYLLEVPPSVQNLRSRSSSILLNVKDGQMFVWHGAKSSKETRARVMECAENIQKKAALEFGIDKKAVCFITEIEEGSETARFRRSLGGSATWRSESKPFHNLLKDKSDWSYTPRLFHMTSVSGLFVAKEIQNPVRCGEVICPFPSIQSDLYKAPQPALFLLDAGHVVYLWQGWWPEETEEVENVRTGSAESRLNSEKIVAMETCLNYCKAKKPRPPCYVVFGGLEPVPFTNLFPTWQLDEDIKNAQILEGHSEGEQIEISGYLHKLTQTKYTHAQLQERPLPEGVDPLWMEKYLHDDAFEQVLESSREDFYKLPPWKQLNLKKEKGLF